MRSEPSIFVTLVEVGIMVSAGLCGAITGLVGFKFIRKINENFNQVNVLKSVIVLCSHQALFQQTLKNH